MACAADDLQPGALAQALTQRLHAFLKRNVDVLDPHVTATLLASYGRMEDLMQYASCRQVGALRQPGLRLMTVKPTAGLMQRLPAFLGRKLHVLDLHFTGTVSGSNWRMEDLMQYASYCLVGL